MGMRCYKVSVSESYRAENSVIQLEDSYLHIVTDDIAKIVKEIGNQNIIQIENLGKGKFL